MKAAMHWFQFPQIQELTSPSFTSFIRQCYSFSVHSALFIMLAIILVACLNKELSLWWIFSYLVFLIGRLENERSLTIFYQRQIIHAYIHTYIHTSYLHLSDFLQINTSHIQQIITICVNTLLANGILPSILDRKIKWIEVFQSGLMASSIGISSLIGIIYSMIL